MANPVKVRISPSSLMAALLSDQPTPVVATPVTSERVPITPAVLLNVVAAKVPNDREGASEPETTDGFVALAEYGRWQEPDTTGGKPGRIHKPSRRLIVFRNAKHFGDSTEKVGSELRLRSRAYVSTIREDMLALFAAKHGELTK